MKSLQLICPKHEVTMAEFKASDKWGRKRLCDIEDLVKTLKLNFSGYQLVEINWDCTKVNSKDNWLWSKSNWWWSSNLQQSDASMIHWSPQRGKISLLSEATDPTVSLMLILSTGTHISVGRHWESSGSWLLVSFYSSLALSEDTSLTIKWSKAKERYVPKPWSLPQVSFRILLTSLRFGNKRPYSFVLLNDLKNVW